MAKTLTEIVTEAEALVERLQAELETAKDYANSDCQMLCSRFVRFMSYIRTAVEKNETADTERLSDWKSIVGNLVKAIAEETDRLGASVKTKIYVKCLLTEEAEITARLNDYIDKFGISFELKCAEEDTEADRDADKLCEELGITVAELDDVNTGKRKLFEMAGRASLSYILGKLNEYYQSNGSALSPESWSGYAEAGGEIFRSKLAVDTACIMGGTIKKEKLVEITEILKAARRALSENSAFKGNEDYFEIMNMLFDCAENKLADIAEKEICSIQPNETEKHMDEVLTKSLIKASQVISCRERMKSDMKAEFVRHEARYKLAALKAREELARRRNAETISEKVALIRQSLGKTNAKILSRQSKQFKRFRQGLAELQDVLKNGFERADKGRLASTIKGIETLRREYAQYCDSKKCSDPLLSSRVRLADEAMEMVRVLKRFPEVSEKYFEASDTAPSMTRMRSYEQAYAVKTYSV